ncbi:hypothetical protein Pint_29523 [Pistacia integerrima]|uniref:Uncharacterized protein n=1 Tax=Pistacia integerrima TaxID=434235 RepID=A0ACC0X214_9ROSI|nr:hypothetical protein Pint_29523 [Pistacia integerrima]
MTLSVGKVETETNSRIETFESNNRQFSYSEVLKITNNFQRIIGKGGFGTVYYGRLSDGTEVAVKMLSSETAQGFQQFQTEVKLLMRVHHRNLTSLVGYCDDDDKMALVYEFMANGNLQEHLSDSKRIVLSWQGRLRMAVESAQGQIADVHLDWVSSLVAKGDIKSIIDPRLQGDFSVNSAWKSVEVAMACLALTGHRRPTMSQVVTELSECLASEMARTQSGPGLDSNDSVDRMISMNLGSVLSPGAR